jgi:large subunit ribosomal protein L3
MSMSEQLGLLGRKVGMTRIFTDDGDTIPVTVLDVSNNRVTQVKTAATDGYNALQVVFGSRKASRVTKPEAGHLAKAGVEAGEVLKEFRVTAEVAGQYKAGAVLPVSVFAAGHMGDETVTTQNLDIVRVDEARSLLLVRGAVPGHKNGHVVVRPAIKVRVKKGAQ